MYDLVIIGGGPAGSTAAGLLACAGRRVIVSERERFPRFHISESLLPFSMKAFTRLGLHEKFSAAQERALVREIRAVGKSGNGRLSSVRQCVVHERVHRSFPRATQCGRSCTGRERCAWRKCRQQLPNSLADVGLLFPVLVATALPCRPKADARAEERRSACIHRNGTHGTMRSEVGTIHRIARVFLALICALRNNRPCLVCVLAACCLTSCATISHHQFSQPTGGWQTKAGQLMYRTPKTTLIGDAVVRFSKSGDFELTFSKGPGITLLSLRQDPTFAEFNANFTGQHWSGPIAQAPTRLRGWLGLRDQFLRAPNQKIVQYVSGNETFLFQF